MLEEIEPQHPSQPHRWAASLALGVMRFDERRQLWPGYQGLRSLQKCRLTRDALLSLLAQ